jgi:hypothetical protein
LKAFLPLNFNNNNFWKLQFDCHQPPHLSPHALPLLKGGTEQNNK